MAIDYSARDETVYYFGGAEEPDAWFACWEFNGLYDASWGATEVRRRFCSPGRCSATGAAS